jgi:hypothetical protein
LETEEENVRYVFQTKIAFLLSLSNTKNGSQSLIDYGILEVFTDSEFLDNLPKFENNFEDSYEKYFAVMNPVFELLLSILSNSDLPKEKV